MGSTLGISMVALVKSPKISGSGIAKAWAERWPNGPLMTNPEKSQNSISFQVGKHTIVYGLMPAPIPWADLEQPCATSRFWRDATTHMKQHERHAIVTVMGESTPVETMKVLTQATVAFTEGCQGVVGVYWCSSSLVLAPQQFRDIACTFVPMAPALPLWVNISLVKNEDGSLAGFTRGLSALQLMEFETKKSPESPEDLQNRLLGLSAYVIENGLVIRDGDTIGESASEKIKVTYRDSAFGADGKVMQLSYPNQSSSSSRMTLYGKLHGISTILFTIALGWLVYSYAPFLRDSFLRHFIFIPVILFCGIVTLFLSDAILRRLFGFEAFTD